MVLEVCSWPGTQFSTVSLQLNFPAWPPTTNLSPPQPHPSPSLCCLYPGPQALPQMCHSSYTSKLLPSQLCPPSYAWSLNICNSHSFSYHIWETTLGSALLRGWLAQWLAQTGSFMNVSETMSEWMNVCTFHHLSFWKQRLGLICLCSSHCMCTSWCLHIVGFTEVGRVQQSSVKMAHLFPLVTSQFCSGLSNIQSLI